MQDAGSTEPPKDIVQRELSTLSNNITNCLSAVSLKVGSDKETAGQVEECVIAAEELQTLGELVRTDIKAISDSVAAINEQIEQLEEERTIDSTGKRISQSRKTPEEQEKIKAMMKKTEGLPEFIEIEGESEDDVPQEASSKVQLKTSGPESASDSKKEKLKKRTKRRRKYKMVKLKENLYQSETKSSTFKVVPLSVSQPPPAINFRAKLLQKRTQEQRIRKVEHAGLQHKAKWFAATRQRGK